jgi:gluconolactonase
MTDHHDLSVIGPGTGEGTLTGEGMVTGQPEGMGFEVYDPEFAAALGDDARLELVAETDAHEGPVYIPGHDALYFTTLPRPGDIPAPGTPQAVIKRLALAGLDFPVDESRLSALPADVHMPNGMTLGHDGRLVVCEQGTRSEHARISRVDPVTGQVEGLVAGWGGLRLNSPNDVVARGDGTIWFTDPSYGYLQGFRPEPQLGDYVYRFDPAPGRLSVVADCFDKPNGLAFSPDEQILYITDSGANQEPGSYHVQRPHHILAFDVRDGTHLAGGRLFAVTTPGFPDGLKTDPAGRVYASSPGGVQVFSPAGDLIGQISVPGAVNFTFGGPGGDVLFITTDTAIWAAVLSTAAGTSQRHDQAPGRW